MAYFDILPIALYREKISQTLTPEVRNTLDHLTINPNKLSDEMHLLDREEFRSLKEEIYTHIRKYEKDILGFTGDLKLKITESWYRETVPDDNQDTHKHGNSLLSGCVYVQVPKQPSDLDIPSWDGLGHSGINFVHRDSYGVFKDFKFLYKQIDTKYNSKNSFLRVENNDIVLFPSHIDHFVSYNKSQENLSRKVISFNTFIEGNMSLDNSWPSKLTLNTLSDNTVDDTAAISVTSRKESLDGNVPVMDIPKDVKDVNDVINYISDFAEFGVNTVAVEGKSSFNMPL